ncbi:MAG: hypothetical protein EA358_04170 [Flavobacteriales bacterium]|nr:MAG: hypothetical protein EA358_04170 [Flavobacteriales bacterium]
MPQKRKFLLFRGTIRLLSLITLSLLWLSLLAIFIPPHIFPILGLVTLGLPVFFIAHTLFLIWYLARGKKYAYLLLITSFFTITSFHSWVSLGSKVTDNEASGRDFSVMTFNVRMFNVYEWLDGVNVPNAIAELVNDSLPDILMIQEFYMFKQTPEFDFPYQHIHYSNPQQNFGLAIYSNFPFINKGEVAFEKTEGFNNYFIYADTEIFGDTVRLINVHLASFYFDVRDFQKLKAGNNTEEIQSSIVSISKSLFKGFKRRSLQVQTLKEFIDASPYPILLCGDMNDVPASYTYRMLNRRLTDAFAVKGKGIGRTYLETVFPLRIDWVFFSNENWYVKKYQSVKTESPLSDHRPVMVRFRVPN